MYAVRGTPPSDAHTLRQITDKWVSRTLYDAQVQRLLPDVGPHAFRGGGGGRERASDTRRAATATSAIEVMRTKHFKKRKAERGVDTSKGL